MLAVRLRGTLIHYPQCPLIRCFISSAGICKAKDLRRPLRMLSIARERVQRKRIPVQVILQVENARETRAGKFLFVPGTVFILVFGEPAQPRVRQPDRSGPTVASKPIRAPGRLRSGALPFSFQRRVVIGQESIRRSRHRDSAPSATNSRRAGNRAADDRPTVSSARSTPLVP